MSSKIIYDAQILGLMKRFEQMTHAKIKDCIVEPDKVIFVVLENEARKAIGKDAVNVKRFAEMLKKKIKIVEYSGELLKLIKNFIYPLKVLNISEQDGIVVIESPDVKTRGILIGRAGQNLRQLEDYIRRYVDVKEIKVA